MAEGARIHRTLGSGGRRGLRLTASVAAAIASSLLPAFAQDSEKDRVDGIVARSKLDARTRSGLAHSLGFAIRKLETSSCREVFTAFPGAWEPPAPPESPADHAASLFDAIVFRSGTPYRACRDSRVVAFTHPGERTVYLCTNQFNTVAFGTPDYAANILIHEGLHTLGLRENPPAPAAITARIAASCRNPAPPQAHEGNLDPATAGGRN